VAESAPGTLGALTVVSVATVEAPSWTEAVMPYYCEALWVNDPSWIEAMMGRGSPAPPILLFSVLCASALVAVAASRRSSFARGRK
jgi:hypothetical protein